MDIEINGKTYTMNVFTGGKLDMFYYKEVLYDEMPKGTIVKQYVVLDDGSKVGICSSKTWKVFVVVLLALAGAALVMGGLAFAMKTLHSNSIKSDVEIINDSTEDTVVSMIKDTDYIIKYNRFTIIDDGYINILYQNIDKETEIYIDGVDCEPVKVEANDFIPTFKVNMPEDTAYPVNATFIVKVGKSKYSVPIVINDVDSINEQRDQSQESINNRTKGSDDTDSSTSTGSSSSNIDPEESYKDMERSIHD